jgi:hypothetical protein
MNLRLCRLDEQRSFGQWAFFETEEDGVLGEWETHFVTARTLFEENYSGKLQAGCALRPDCESG